MMLYAVEMSVGLFVLFVTGLFFLKQHKRSRHRKTRDQIYTSFLVFAVVVTGFTWALLIKTMGERLCSGCL